MRYKPVAGMLSREIAPVSPRESSSDCCPNHHLIAARIIIRPGKAWRANLTDHSAVNCIACDATPLTETRLKSLQDTGAAKFDIDKPTAAANVLTAKINMFSVITFISLLR